MFSVQLNRFIHRINDKAQIQEIALKHEVVLRRIRRSSTWQLSGSEDALRLMYHALNNEDQQWIKAAIEKLTARCCAFILSAYSPNISALYSSGKLIPLITFLASSTTLL